MQVRELKKILETLPDNLDCRIDKHTDVESSVLMLRIVHDTKSVIFCDHYVIRQPKTITAHDGTEYEIPWP
jgi:hypothetical protein